MIAGRGQVGESSTSNLPIQNVEETDYVGEDEQSHMKTKNRPKIPKPYSNHRNNDFSGGSNSSKAKKIMPKRQAGTNSSQNINYPSSRQP